jgi:hypothetical protein
MLYVLRFRLSVMLRHPEIHTLRAMKDEGVLPLELSETSTAQMTRCWE